MTRSSQSADVPCGNGQCDNYRQYNPSAPRGDADGCSLCSSLTLPLSMESTQSAEPYTAVYDVTSTLTHTHPFGARSGVAERVERRDALMTHHSNNNNQYPSKKRQNSQTQSGIQSQKKSNNQTPEREVRRASPVGRACGRGASGEIPRERATKLFSHASRAHTYGCARVSRRSTD